MREIKFRAWLYPYKRMIYEFNLLQKQGGFHLWLPGEEYLPGSFELMEYTGLHDKNDKEIYEGDILRFDLSEMGYIELGFIEFIDSGFWMKSPNGQIHLPTQERREVIGNIHENPELLK